MESKKEFRGEYREYVEVLWDKVGSFF